MLVVIRDSVVVVIAGCIISAVRQVIISEVVQKKDFLDSEKNFIL